MDLMFVESPFRFHPLEVRYKNTTMNFHSCVMLFWVPNLQNSAYIYLLRTAFFLPSSYILGHLQSHSIGECEWVFHFYAVGVRDNSSIYSECIVFYPHFPCFLAHSNILFWFESLSLFHFPQTIRSLSVSLLLAQNWTWSFVNMDDDESVMFLTEENVREYSVFGFFWRIQLLNFDYF